MFGYFIAGFAVGVTICAIEEFSSSSNLLY